MKLTESILAKADLSLSYTKEEYESLTPAKRMAECQRVTDIYKEAGADHVIKDISGLLEL